MFARRSSPFLHGYTDPPRFISLARLSALWPSRRVLTCLLRQTVAYRKPEMSVPTALGQRAFACIGSCMKCSTDSEAWFSVQHGERCLGRAPITAISKKPWKEHKDLNQACASSCQCKFCEMSSYFRYNLPASSVRVKYIYVTRHFLHFIYPR